MPSYTGETIVARALSLAGIIDPTETPTAEVQTRALQAINDLIDAWRTDNLTIGALTRSVYPLVAGQDSYTIGQGGEFNQAYPSAIYRWAVIPDDGASPLTEIPRGRPLEAAAWQAMRIKENDGAYPTALYFDHDYGPGPDGVLGTVHVYPAPTGSTVSLVLYQKVQEIPELAIGTTYALRPGAARALRWNAAIEVAIEWGVPENITALMDDRARTSLAALKRSNIRSTETRTRPEFLVSTRRRSFNVRTDE